MARSHRIAEHAASKLLLGHAMDAVADAFYPHTPMPQLRRAM
ncbi:MAG: hypothetical protein JWP14_1401 [Frankiales bacterium]|jgi:hypothetical protein|nr:hypothetical protein [Frankiales bacterium]